MKHEPQKQPKITDKAVGRPGREKRKSPVIKTSLKTRGRGLKTAGRHEEMEIDILSQIKDAVICLDEQERVFCWNHEAENLYGVKAEDALGRIRDELFRNEWIEPIDESDARQSLGKFGYWQGENIHILNNGDSIYVASSLSVLKRKNNAAIGVLAVIRDITARKKAELDREKLLTQIVKQQLRIEESLFTIEKERDFLKTVMENSGTCIAYLDTDFNFLMANSAYAKNSGFDLHELIGRNHFELFPGEENLAIFRHVRDTCMPAKYQDVPFSSLAHPELGTTYWNWVLTPVNDPNGTTRGMVLVGMETTPLKRAREALQEAEERYRIIVENAFEGILLADPEGFMTFVNRRMAEMLGYQIDELVGKQFLDLVISDQLPSMAVRRQQRREGIVEQYDLKMAKKDGSVIWAMNHSVPLFSKGKTFTGYLAIFADISERRATEAELAHLASFPEKNPMPVIEMSVSGDISYMNSSARRNFPDMLALGRSHPFLAGVEEMVDEVRDETHTITREVQIGDSWFEETVFYDKTNRNFRFYGRDVTARKKVDQMKDDFIGMVSHEMRTPLTVIMGGLDTLCHDGDKLDPKERRQLLEDAVAESDDLSHILDNLLELSRSQSDRLKIAPRALALSELAQKVVNKFREQPDHQFKMKFGDGIPVVEADPLRIERVIFNLVQNAVKYSPQGGPIELSADRLDGFVRVGIKDSGIGIPEQEQALLFNRFQRVEGEKYDASRGVGLGLVVCKRLIEAHGGRIWLESEKGQGTTVFFMLPIKPAG